MCNSKKSKTPSWTASTQSWTNQSFSKMMRNSTTKSNPFLFCLLSQAKNTQIKNLGLDHSYTHHWLEIKPCAKELMKLSSCIMEKRQWRSKKIHGKITYTTILSMYCPWFAIENHWPSNNKSLWVCLSCTLSKTAQFLSLIKLHKH